MMKYPTMWTQDRDRKNQIRTFHKSKLKLWGYVLALLSLLLVSPGEGQGDRCDVFRATDGGSTIYVTFPDDNFVSGPVDLYINTGCTEFAYEFDAGNHGLVYAPDQEGAAATCDASNGGDNQAFRELTATNDNIWWCYVEPDAAARPDAGGESRRTGAANRNAGRGDNDQKRQFVCTGALLNKTELMVSAVDGLCSGIQFQRVSPAGVGNEAVLNQGYLDAVDTWSNIGRGYEVCFPQVGRLIFLDSAITPRMPSWVTTNIRGEFTCAFMDRAGTLVLVNAPNGTAQDSTMTTTATTPARRPGTDDPISSAIALEDCAVTPRVNLRLRAAPWGKITEVVPAGTEVPADSRTSSWFFVSYGGFSGWIAAWLSTAEGNCDWTDAD